MRSKSVPKLFLAAAAMALTTAACSTDVPLSPTQTAPPQIRKGIIAPQLVLNTQLRSVVEGSVAYGHIQLKFVPPNTVVPPNPVRVTLSGRIFNPNNEDIYSNAGIYFAVSTSDGLPPAFAFSITPPTEACGNVSLEGSFDISPSLASDLAEATSSFALKFGGTQGLLGFAPPSGHPDVPPNPVIPATSHCGVEVTG